MYDRNIHFVPTQQLQAPDPSWLDDEFEGGDEFVQDPRYADFSMEVPAPTAAEIAPDDAGPGDVFVKVGPVDDTFEQAILASGVGVVVVGGMCLTCSFLGFVIGLLVAT
jgi:hypothetical protein